MGEVDCYGIHQVRNKCEFIENNTECAGSGYIPFTRIYYCTEQPLSDFLLFLFFLLLIVFFYLLSTTVDRYLRPCLEYIARVCLLSKDVAGATLIAFGNGATDVFASVVAISNGSYGLAVGDAVGMGLFASCFAVGWVIVLARELDSWTAYWRDAGFFLSTMIFVFIVTVVNQVKIFVPIVLLVSYGLYVGLAVGLDVWKNRRISPEARATIGFSTKKKFLESQEPTAPRNTINNVLPIDPESSIVSNVSQLHVPSRAQCEELSLVLSRTSDGAVLSHLQPGTCKPNAVPIESSPRQAFCESSVVNSSRDPSTAEPAGFSHGIEAGSLNLPAADSSTQRCLSNSLQRSQPVSNEAHDIASSGQAPEAILPSVSNGETPNDHPGASISRGDDVLDKASVPSPSRASVAALLVYFSLFRRGFLKVMRFLEIPVNVLRTMTIPSVEFDEWNALIGCTSVSLAPVSVYLLSGHYDDYIGQLPVFAVLLIVGACMGLITLGLYVRTRKPPLQPVLGIIGFGAGAFWMGFFATELVSILECFSLITSIPQSLVGLTVLTWGGTLSDVIMIINFAWTGAPECALAGAYAAPLFDVSMMIGVGLIVYFAHGRSRLEYYAGKDLIVSFSCFFILVASTIIFAILKRGKLPRWFGYLLMALYVVAIILSCLAAAGLFGS